MSRKYVINIEVDDSVDQPGWLETKIGWQTFYGRTDESVVSQALSYVSTSNHEIKKFNTTPVKHDVPENLKTALEESKPVLSTEATEVVKKFIGMYDEYKDWSDSYWSNYDSKKQVPELAENIHIGHRLLCGLISNISEAITGYAHYSDKFDDENVTQLMSYIGWNKESSDDESSDDGSGLDKYEIKDSVQNRFSLDLKKGLKGVEVKNVDATKDVFDFAVKEFSFKGTVQELADAFKYSSTFSSILQYKSTEYTG